MAKFKADIKFRGIKENKEFEKNEEFEMTVKRAEELEANIKKEHKDIEKVMTRLDKEDPEDK
ncbi:hypothetical protein CAT7_04924 [Carnobacterium sp. AT7]|uniref:hypothetical protein n=1 Tax=Carnobacterium sp. AT7 TaxID=333990 RepID=UPI00015F19F5|nr:hypothetical protein [Carnobacterium sp. AT7]EDP68581.1 hypothetical protein CAT7_04924 [Carnobacterium sp. AT7]